MDKQRNRDNRHQKRKLNAKKSRRATPQAGPSQSKNASVVNNESSHESDDDIYDYLSKNFAQPKSRYANYPEADIKSTCDFEDLKNASVSCSYFQFESEKNWTEDISKYSELLAIDLRKLETIVDCIPHYHLIEVDDTYFTKDQLTHYNSSAEQSKKLYESELLERKQVKEQDYQNDDLDYLLSLKEPEPMKPTLVTTSSLFGNNEEPNVSTSTSDNDKWLDTLLDIRLF